MAGLAANAKGALDLEKTDKRSISKRMSRQLVAAR
jgi:hypothetical protein